MQNWNFLWDPALAHSIPFDLPIETSPHSPPSPHRPESSCGHFLKNEEKLSSKTKCGWTIAQLEEREVALCASTTGAPTWLLDWLCGTCQLLENSSSEAHTTNNRKQPQARSEKKLKVRRPRMNVGKCSSPALDEIASKDGTVWRTGLPAFVTSNGYVPLSFLCVFSNLFWLCCFYNIYWLGDW